MNLKMVTETSVYLLDLEEMTATRLAGEAPQEAPGWPVSELRQDGEPIPMFAPPVLQVGRPCVLMLSIVPGMVTLRETTPVREVVELS